MDKLHFSNTLAQTRRMSSQVPLPDEPQIKECEYDGCHGAHFR
jgi:hypothetical protein